MDQIQERREGSGQYFEARRKDEERQTRRTHSLLPDQPLERLHLLPQPTQVPLLLHRVNIHHEVDSDSQSWIRTSVDLFEREIKNESRVSFVLPSLPPAQTETSTHLDPSNEPWIGIVHHDILGPQLLQHLVIIIPFVRPYHDELFGRENSEVVVEIQRIEVACDGVLS